MHNFGEKEKEFNLPVWQSPKYLASKKKAIEMIESGKYGLEDSDFLDDVYRKLRMEYQMEDEPKCEIVKAFRKYGY